MASYAKHVSTKQTPQSAPIPGKPMTLNSAGGYVFAVDDWTRLDRFLVLGCEGGTFYAGEHKLTVENAQCVLRCAVADAKRTVDRIIEISEAGRAPKNDPAIFALALIASQGGPAAKAVALAAVNRVCRIGTHLFQFAEACNEMRGWGRGLRRAVAQWYTGKSPEKVAYQVVKYQQRNGWSHRDLLRLCHLKGANEPLNSILKWAVKGVEDGQPIDPTINDALNIVCAFEAAKKADEKNVCKLIREYGLTREMLPTEMLTKPEVWEALLEKMPLTAMIRNLANMTRIGLLAPMSNAVGKVITELTDAERLQKSRVHPIAVLAALLTYKQGHGERGKNTWTPVQQIVDALDAAFYKAFGNVEPTNKRHMLALDVSGSMTMGTIAGVPGLTPRVGAAAMALVTANVEKQHFFGGFTCGFTPLNISPRQRLDDVVRYTDSLPFGGTDCSLPMTYALHNKMPIDVFTVYTDNETWFGTIHPCQALQVYRSKMGIPAKLVVVGMTSTQFSIADPNDSGALDVVGFDTATPQIISDFAGGQDGRN